MRTDELENLIIKSRRQSVPLAFRLVQRATAVMLFATLPALIFLLLFSCTSNQEKPPSILIIAVDGLASQMVSCLDEDVSRAGGFSVLCHESIRFQNAFTSSTMSEAALASIFTGLYPYQHGLRDNSAHSYLSTKFDNIAQDALQAGFRTSLFSGGPPIWRSSGLNHGFELFEDNLNLSVLSTYRPMHQSVDLFLNWVQHEVHQEPFLGVIYAPDLRFPSVVTRDGEGAPREIGAQGQLEEVEESIDILITKLRAMHRWDSTLVIFMGLNGSPNFSNKNSEIVGVNLFDENVKVALFVKPPQNSRDLPLSWVVDQNVSLVDIGRTLKEEFGVRTHALPLFPTTSLLKEFHNKTENHETERPLLIESGWPSWRGYGGIRYAIRKNYFEYIADETPKVYNALIDPRFGNPLNFDSPVAAALGQELEPLMRQLGDQPRFRSIPTIDRQKFELARDLWGDAASRKIGSSKLNELHLRYPSDVDLVVWKARLALEQNEWANLQSLGLKYDNLKWAAAAEHVLKSHSNKSWNSLLREDSCWRAVFNPGLTKMVSPSCENEVILRFLAFLQTNNQSGAVSTEAERTRDNFIRDFSRDRLDFQIASSNYASGLNWDTRMSVLNQIPDMELILKMPEFKAQAELVRRRALELKL